MTKIKIIKKQDSYVYIYDLIDKDNKTIYITKSGFTTLEEALEAAKKSYNKHTNNKKNYPIHVEKTKHTKEKINTNKYKKAIIKNLKITDGGYRIIEALTFSAVAIVFVFGGAKIITDLNDKLPKPSNNLIEAEENENKVLLTPSDCDFSNLHIVIRTAQTNTLGVGREVSDMLTRLGASNEVIDKDSDLSQKITDAISNNPDSNIVIINLETGLENSKDNNTIIMGDSSNRREYSSDVLASCINASLNEYDLDPVIKSGVVSGIWRTQSYLEKDLSDAALINSVSQLTIDLPITIIDDTITKNDAAASIVEGIMRWTTLDSREKYKNIYYTAEYGDTIVSIMNDTGISIKDMEENSDIDMHKGVRVGNTFLVAPLPEVATDKFIVYNPYTTTDSSAIEPVVITYVVENNDTVTKIANMYGVEIDDIVVPSGNINNIHPGDILYITTQNLYETHKKTDIKEK